MAERRFEPHLASADCSVLLVIDLQERLLAAIEGSAAVVSSTCKLMEIAGLLGVPVILTEQYPRGLGESAPPVKTTFENVRSEKHLVTKDSFSCALSPAFLECLVNLEQTIAAKQTRQLIDEGIRTRPLDLVVAGIEAHVCVWQTVLGLLHLEYYVRVCHDCVGSRSPESKHWALASMLSLGAVVESYESVAFEWARDKNHPHFKQLSRIIKG